MVDVVRDVLRGRFCRLPWGSNSSDPEQTESLNDDTGSYDPNEEARGNSDRVRYLSTLTDHYTAKNGDILTGTLRANVNISIADGAAVTLKNVTINGVNDESCEWAGITCSGDGVLILKGSNHVKGFYENCPGIYIPENKTLTIKGKGSLTASSNGYGAGIGGGWYISCGNIVIEGGRITATGGNLCPGIGGGPDERCGYITITRNVTKVTATRGENAPYSVGAGARGTCGTVTIGVNVGPSSEPMCIYPPNAR